MEDRERERERERESERGRECVCVCERERERDDYSNILSKPNRVYINDVKILPIVEIS